MMYPIFMIGFSLTVVGGLVAFVVPNVVKAFSQTGKELPAPTKFLLSLADFLTNNFLILLIFLILFIGGFLYWKSLRLGYKK